MIGWAAFITLLILVGGFFQDMQAGWGNAFGYPSPQTNWSIIKIILITGWVVLILYKFGLIHFGR